MAEHIDLSPVELPGPSILVHTAALLLEMRGKYATVGILGKRSAAIMHIPVVWEREGDIIQNKMGGEAFTHLGAFTCSRFY